MTASPLLYVHIFAAVVGLLSGYLSMLLRKGSGLHQAAGNVFVVSMLAMASSAVYISIFIRPIMINVVAGSLTLYLVSTGWWAARRRDGRTGLFDRGALLFVLLVAMSAFVFGFQAANGGLKHGIPAPVYFIFGIGALLCAVTDVRMLRRGGVVGPQRMVRHLWRMSVALLIATLSFYPGQAKLFPLSARTPLLFVPHLFLIGSMIFWRLRMRARKRARREPVIGDLAASAVRT